MNKNESNKYYEVRTVSWGDPYKEPEKYLYNFRKWLGDMNTQYIKTMAALKERRVKND